MAAPPVPDPVERFRADLAALTGGSQERVGVAVSGGPDSLALLLLAAAALPGRIEAATVNHGLRTESAAEAEFVARICGSLGVPHAVLCADVDSRAASLQQAAREARYRALGGWLAERSLVWLATGHHLDDQAETVLMRLMRGAGSAGMAAIRARGPVPASAGSARLVRPLLGWRRDELRAIVLGAGIEPVEDPSNADERFDRARARRLLAETPWLDRPALARAAAALAEGDEALEWMADQLWQGRVERKGEGFSFSPAGLPREMVRRMLGRLLAALHPEARPRGEEIGRLIARLERGGVATLAGVRCTGGAVWTFLPAPPRRAQER
jgi:tRNA(Ile)-lysidine synthase